MRIGIDASPILRRVGGVGWHTYHLLRALIELKEDLQFIGYVQPGSLRRHGGELTEEWINHPRLRWVEAGRLTRRWRGRLDRLDLYHGTNFKMRTVGKHGGIVTIHDLWLNRNPQYSTKLFGQRRAADKMKQTIARARKIITVSEHSAREIAELYGVSRQNLAVIYNGVSDDFQPITERGSFRDLRERMALPTERFILFAGGADPRKNHQTLLRAYARRAASLKDYSVVMVGEAAHRFGDIRQTARTFDLEERVFCPGLLRMEELRLLYSHAAVFVFPSLYEGFGMPLLEAMACGAPVVASNTTSLPEVAGDAAILVDPLDADELGEAVIRVLESHELRADLRAKGFERAKQFTWERAAQQTLAVYREVCAGSGT